MTLCRTFLSWLYYRKEVEIFFNKAKTNHLETGVQPIPILGVINFGDDSLKSTIIRIHPRKTELQHGEAVVFLHCCHLL
jgi:hypothetical protein